MQYILAIDQGTTSSRAIIYNDRLEIIASEQRDFTQYFPRPGWVEHDALEIWETVLDTVKKAIANAGIHVSDIVACGITNQRETAVVWNRKTGIPVYRAIVWQDRRTGESMDALREAEKEPFIQQRTGLLLDPYFSASKFRWIFQEIPEGEKLAESGDLAVGTIDSWLIYKMTLGVSHITDVSNASRTMLMNIRTGDWDPDLMALFHIPRSVLPCIGSSSGNLGMIDASFFGASLPICSAIGDQQAALFGQLCTKPELVKCTFGTGCFLLKFTGCDAVTSSNRLLTTVAWKIGEAPLQYALEGSVFMGGASVQWLHDGLGIIKNPLEVNVLANSVSDSGGVTLVPAFTGLGAPYWDADARGAIFGLTRGSTAAHIARATLEGIAFQVADVVHAMQKDSGKLITTLRVDGGACASNLLMQIESDTLGCTVERPVNIESTSLGAAMLAGLGAGIWPNVDVLSKMRAVDRKFEPEISNQTRRSRAKIWKKAVQRAKKWSTQP